MSINPLFLAITLLSATALLAEGTPKPEERAAAQRATKIINDRDSGIAHGDLKTGTIGDTASGNYVKTAKGHIPGTIDRCDSGATRPKSKPTVSPKTNR